MRKLTTLAAACGLAFCVNAHAQSSVTLYGILDAGIAYIHNSGGHSSQWKMSTGNISENEWGLRGTEDLGGGLAANFQVENGFDIASGQLHQNGRLFGRQAWVGLASPTTWGAVTLGRQYDPISDVLQPLTADAFSGIFATPGDVDNYDSSARFDNAVKWVSPNWGGVKLEAMYSFGGIAGATGSGQVYSGAASYNHGPFSIAGGYIHIDNGNATLSTRGTSASDSLFNSAVNAAYASAHAIDIARIGGNYVIDQVTVGAAYSYSKYSPDGHSTFTDSQKFQNGSVYATWQLSPAFQTTIGYNYTKSTGDSSATYHQVALGVDYLLSKRTDLYAVAAYQHASGQNGAGHAQAVIGSYDVNSGANYQVLTVAGIRHSF
ncbi:putative porin [Paraburkholderia sp. BL6669N2]|uniref:porin n=1 Tax=Paraburkholderia sp. BL6669N2 TaxID=1938807 RepID=UPI000E25B01C|nr:porin [Paraburkholderia sp. BL6669N2]REG60824.1 putative porin [Paraburkholderia sp. BL6669N2]